ncbi:hypothetical protein M404DRAFT_66704, partial [Pisolithus tinctorius Marx 270]
YLRHRLDMICSPFFPCTMHLTDMLSACDAIVSRSAALWMLLPANACNWSSSDLDIYVSFNSQPQLYNLLRKHHYNIIHEGRTNRNDYSPSTIFTVTTFGNGRKNIDVIVSRTSSALSPIFQFHSTAVMNFFTADSLFCVYPSLTLHHRALINTASLRNRTFPPSHMQALLKYKSHRFQFISSLNDSGWLSLDFATVPH